MCLPACHFRHFLRGLSSKTLVLLVRLQIRHFRHFRQDPLLFRYRPKGVFGKGVGNSKSASEMRQKCVKMGLVLLGKEERSKMRRKCISKLRQKCVKNTRNTFGGEHLLDDTDCWQGAKARLIKGTVLRPRMPRGPCETS